MPLRNLVFKKFISLSSNFQKRHLVGKQFHAGARWRTLSYWIKRVCLNLAMLEQLDLIGRTGELARAFGIDFFSVLTRGSQYRVESLLVRMAHSQNYLMLSPDREQVLARLYQVTACKSRWLPKSLHKRSLI